MRLYQDVQRHTRSGLIKNPRFVVLSWWLDDFDSIERITLFHFTNDVQAGHNVSKGRSDSIEMWRREVENVEAGIS